MAQFLQFLLNHWALAGLWLALAVALLVYLNAKSGGSVSPHQAVTLVNKEEGIVLDVRDRKEFEKGHIVDATNIPLAKLADRAVELEKHQNAPIIVVCQFGQQAGTAVSLLQAKGFSRAIKLAGGLAEWQASNLPLVR